MQTIFKKNVKKIPDLWKDKYEEIQKKLQFFIKIFTLFL